MTFTPCSTKHRSCSPAHAELVSGYRLARHHEEVQFEAMTGGHPVDAAFLKAKGHKLIDFKQWLIGHRRTEQAA